MEINNSHFYVKQLATGCLSQYAYYIESNNQAAIIDPLRDTRQYIDLLAERQAKLKYVIPTHIHADFVCGYWDLAQKTGAQIILGPKEEIKFEHLRGDDGKVFGLGDIELHIIHTPGHTLESISILLVNPKENNKQVAVFTGDTLFVGEVGRPDLAVKSGETTQRDLTDLLFDSLRKLMELDDNCVLMPGHGAGSSCGKNLGKESSSTIGEQKANNYALKIETKDELYNSLTHNLPTPPDYFFHDVYLNLHNDTILTTDQILEKAKNGLSVNNVQELLKDPNHIIIDTRDPPKFCESHIPHALNIPIKGNVAIWTASILEPTKKLIIVCDDENVEESIIRLTRTGMDNIVGYLNGGMDAWIAENNSTATIKAIKPTDIDGMLKDNEHCIVVDVRSTIEIEAGTLNNARFVDLKDIDKKAVDRLDKHAKLLILCRTGMRAVVACSLLQRQGYDVSFIEGGFVAVKDQGLDVVMPKLS